MNQIEKQAFRDAGNLDAVSYFQFIIREGYRLSFIGPDELEHLQYQIMILLADQFNRWTGGQSSSVPVETGQRIQQSVFYTVGCYLKSLPDGESALNELKSRTLDELYQRGRDRIGTVKKEAEALLHAIQQNPFKTCLLAYNETLNEGLPMFFTTYDTDFDASNTSTSIDYPLGNDKMNLTGVEYIYDYLQKLRLENEFCNFFDREEIHSLLRGYDRGYKELLFNIYDLVLTNAVGCMLIGRCDHGVYDRGLHLSEYDRRYLQKELAHLSAEKLNELTDDAITLLCDQLSVSDPEMISYMKLSSVNLQARLKHALEVSGLQRLFLSTKDEEVWPVIEFEDKAALDQDAFLKLADEIRGCRFLSDKLSLLRKASPGAGDLIDLLEGDCFYEEEYEGVFSSLDDIQLALLANELTLDPEDRRFLEEENDREWKSSLYHWLSQTDPARKSAIMGFAARIG